MADFKSPTQFIDLGSVQDARAVVNEWRRDTRPLYLQLVSAFQNTQQAIDGVRHGTEQIVAYFQYLIDTGAIALPTAAVSGQTTTVVSTTLTADVMLSQSAPALSGDRLVRFVQQNATGGWNITWDTNLIGATTELGVTAANTRYQFEFVGVDLGGGLVWVKTSELLAF